MGMAVAFLTNYTQMYTYVLHEVQYGTTHWSISQEAFYLTRLMSISLDIVHCMNTEPFIVKGANVNLVEHIWKKMQFVVSF